MLGEQKGQLALASLMPWLQPSIRAWFLMCLACPWWGEVHASTKWTTGTFVSQGRRRGKSSQSHSHAIWTGRDRWQHWPEWQADMGASQVEQQRPQPLLLARGEGPAHALPPYTTVPATPSLGPRCPLPHHFVGRWWEAHRSWFYNVTTVGEGEGSVPCISVKYLIYLNTNKIKLFVKLSVPCSCSGLWVG